MVTLPRVVWIKSTTFPVSNYNRFREWLGLVITKVKICFQPSEAHFNFQHLTSHMLKQALTKSTYHQREFLKEVSKHPLNKQQNISVHQSKQ